MSKPFPRYASRPDLTYHADYKAFQQWLKTATNSHIWLYKMIPGPRGGFLGAREQAHAFFSRQPDGTYKKVRAGG